MPTPGRRRVRELLGEGRDRLDAGLGPLLLVPAGDESGGATPEERSSTAVTGHPVRAEQFLGRRLRRGRADRDVATGPSHWRPRLRRPRRDTASPTREDGSEPADRSGERHKGAHRHQPPGAAEQLGSKPAASTPPASLREVGPPDGPAVPAGGVISSRRHGVRRACHLADRRDEAARPFRPARSGGAMWRRSGRPRRRGGWLSRGQALGRHRRISGELVEGPFDELAWIVHRCRLSPSSWPAASG